MHFEAYYHPLVKTIVNEHFLDFMVYSVLCTSEQGGLISPHHYACNNNYSLSSIYQQKLKQELILAINEKTKTAHEVLMQRLLHNFIIVAIIFLLLGLGKLLLSISSLNHDNR